MKLSIFTFAKFASHVQIDSSRTASNHLRVLTGFIALWMIVCTPDTHAQSAECIQIVKHYHSAVDQYKIAARQYLTEGCQEVGDDKKQCQGLESAAREMKATVEMFSQRAQLLKCKSDDAQKKPQNT